MKEVNRKIIDAVIRKAEKVCPDSLALIGVYGSAATGDEHERSDLDLLLLVTDDAGQQLAAGFILDDRAVGYDIYCTTWDALCHDAECRHAQLSKLLDAKIVYVKRQDVYEDLCRLREETKAFLRSEGRFARVDALMEKAKCSFAELYLSDALGQVRKAAFGVMMNAMDAVMLCRGAYFRRGTKRMPEELAAAGVENSVIEALRQIAEGKDVDALRDRARDILRYAEKTVRRDAAPKAVTAETAGELVGTYEEMFSNWRNKVEEAAQNGDTFAAFADMDQFALMLDEIASQLDVDAVDVMAAYDPERPEQNVALYDAALESYEKAYRKAGLAVRHYADVDAFAAAYLDE